MSITRLCRQPTVNVSSWETVNGTVHFQDNHSLATTSPKGAQNSIAHLATSNSTTASHNDQKKQEYQLQRSRMLLNHTDVFRRVCWIRRTGWFQLGCSLQAAQNIFLADASEHRMKRAAMRERLSQPHVKQCHSRADVPDVT